MLSMRIPAELSDSADERLCGQLRETNFEFTVSNVSLSNGAGFVVVYSGNVMTMPGLSKKPALESINVTDNKITGLF